MFNITDLTLIILGVAILISTYVIEGLQEDSNMALKYFQVIQLMIVYFRAFTYLRIFKWFRNAIHMMIAITITSGSFLIIIASFIIAISVMFVKSNISNDGFSSLLDVEFDSI